MQTIGYLTGIGGPCDADTAFSITTERCVRRALDAIPPSARAALDKLRENGHFVALATGRLQSDALAVLAPQNIDTMVADGGNSITIDGELVSIEGMPLAPSRAFVHRLDANGMGMGRQP